MNKKCFLMAQIIAAGCMICACGAGPDETEKASNTEFVSKGYTVESDTMVTESTENTENTTFSNAALGDVKEQTVKIAKTSVIYSKPDANASQLGSIEKGTKVKALGDVDANGWVMVEYNGRAAYIKAESAGITLSASDTDTDSADESDNDSSSDKKKKTTSNTKSNTDTKSGTKTQKKSDGSTSGTTQPSSEPATTPQTPSSEPATTPQTPSSETPDPEPEPTPTPDPEPEPTPTPDPEPEPEPTPTPDSEPEQSSEQSSEQTPAE